ncbi:MAG: hypothetical protein J7M25_08355 [Deltaproteobacteria bacterium]|nr:hypothetical protein [Deltaproteobacteria bacterium]
MTKTELSDNMIEFLLKKVGGKEALREDYYRDRIGQMTRKRIRIGTLLDEAEQEGWLDFLKKLSVSELVNIAHGSTESSATSHKANKDSGRGSRMTTAMIRELQDSVISFLKDNPWTSVSEISAAVHVPSKKLGPHLRKMIDKKLIQSQGERVKTRYATPEAKR